MEEHKQVVEEVVEAIELLAMDPLLYKVVLL